LIRALIVNDDDGSRLELAERLAAHDGVMVSGVATTVAVARALLRAHDYDVAFVNVDFAEGSGFDLLSDVPAGAAVIFVAKHARQAGRAFDTDVVDFLVRPVRAERLAQALRRAERWHGKTCGAAGPPAVVTTNSHAPRESADVFLDSGSRARFVPVRSIGAIAAQENYTAVRLTDGSRVLVRRSLKEWEDALPADQFVRVHRGVLVNLSQIERYERENPKSVLLYLGGSAEPVRVSRRAWSDLRIRLAGHCGGEMLVRGAW
jgi:two-component system, LytTR family, response regulator